MSTTVRPASGLSSHVVLLALAMLIVGCRAPSDRFALRESTPWRGIIKIGVIAAYSGPTPTNGLSLLAGARLAARDVNAAGGVAGYRLEIVAPDARNRAAAEDLAADPEVLAAIVLPVAGSDARAHVGAPNGLDGHDVLPFLSLAGTRHAGSRDPATWPVSYGLAAAPEDVDRAATIALTTRWGVGAAADAVRRCRDVIERGGGAIVVGHVTLLCGEPPEEIVRSLDDLAGRSVLCLVGCDTPDLAAWLAGTDVAYATPFREPPDDGADWSTAWLGRNEAVPPYTAAGYDAVRLVAAAVARADQRGPPTRASVGRALAATEARGVLGAYGPWGWRDGGAEVREGYPGTIVARTP